MTDKRQPLPRVLDDVWEPPQSNGGRRRAVVATFIGMALIVTCVGLLSSLERMSRPDDQRVWGPIAPVPSERLPDTVVRAEQRPRRLVGYLSINSSPWAELSVDGHAVGSTPQVRIRVTPGRHHLLLVREGFQTHSAWVNVLAGGTVRLTDITLAGITR